MILSELNKLLVNVANSNYLVNQAFVGDVYTINAKENRFGCFVATPMSAVKYSIGSIRYTYYLYYIDRLTKDEANIDFVQSDAVSVLKGIIDFIGNNGVEIEDGYEFTLFREKFSDWCAGAYVNVRMIVPDNECGDDDFNTGGIDLRPLVTDRNGIYEAGVNGGFNRVTINVPQVGATEEWVDNEIDTKLTGYATEEWVGEQGFLTEHQDLSSYATKEYVDDGLDTLREEIPSLEGYATKNWVSSQGYLNSVPITYATKNYVNNQGFLKDDDLDGYATQNWVSSQGYLTSIPSTYATQSWVSAQGYLTSIPSDYATKNYVNNQGFLVEDDLDGYATQAWIQNQGFIVSDSISDMATQTWVRQQAYLVSSDISHLASKTWVGLQGFITEDDLCGYATEAWVNQQGFLTQDDLCGYATEEWTRNWVDNQGFLHQCDLDPYATKNWVENQGYASITYIDEVIDDRIDAAIDDLKEWVDDEIDIKLDGYATEEWVQNQHYLVAADVSGKVDRSEIWTGTEEEWEELTPEEQCSYLIAMIYD